MESKLSMSGLNLSDLSILYVLIAVLILLALIAAIGAWARGGGIKREDAESLFSESRERNREEIARLEELIQEVRETTKQGHDANTQAHSRTQEHLTARLQEVDQQVQKSRSGIEAAVAQAANDQNAALSDELEMVARKLGETERRVTDGLSNMDLSMQRLNEQVSQAGAQLRQTLQEITRQQQEQKAQSTIQLCEALISSLGTLKSTIVHQLEDQHPNPVETDFSTDEEPAALEHSDGTEKSAEYSPVTGEETFNADMASDKSEAETVPDAADAEENANAPAETFTSDSQPASIGSEAEGESDESDVEDESDEQNHAANPFPAGSSDDDEQYPRFS